MSAIQDSKTTFKPNLACIFISVRANWNINVCPWTPCMWGLKSWLSDLHTYFGFWLQAWKTWCISRCKKFRVWLYKSFGSMLACYGVSSMVPKKQATTSSVVGKVIEFTAAQSQRKDFESRWVDFFSSNFYVRRNKLLLVNSGSHWKNSSMV